MMAGDNEGATSAGNVVGNVGGAILAIAVEAGPIEVEGCVAGNPIEVSVGPNVVGGGNCHVG